ncbi:sarcosine oxidase subunit gamma [Tropicimonas aquimaris]|uniref:Sarcosine oxidase subunit gamma n=1 Tax=Tropicimonas aquimaris TaxID=914152 RepID=A0ABW3IQN4_9RHOB
MIRLAAETPLGGLCVSHGDLTLTELPAVRLTLLAPWPGEARAMSHALQAAHGVYFPEPGETLENGGTRILWAGRAQALLAGPAPAKELSHHGAVVDQTEGWAGIRLEGADAALVLARLCPLDLRGKAFQAGRTARSLLGHMNAQITAVDGGFELLVMRSMARTAATEIEHAMRNVAARG